MTSSKPKSSLKIERRPTAASAPTQASPTPAAVTRVELETVIQKHDEEKRIHPKPIDETFTYIIKKPASSTAALELGRVADISNYWVSPLPSPLPPYETANNKQRRAFGGQDETIQTQSRCLEALLSRDFKVFWCSVLFDDAPGTAKTIKLFAYSFLANFPRPWECQQQQAPSEAEKDLYVNGFRLISRLLSRQDSLSWFMSASAFKQRVLSASPPVLSVRNIVDACALFGADKVAGPRLSDILEDLWSDCSDVLVFTSEFKRFSSTLASSSSSLESLLDVAATLATLVRVMPQLCPLMVQHGLLSAICSCYDHLNNNKQANDDDVINTTTTTTHIRSCLLAAAATMMSKTWFEPMGFTASLVVKQQSAAESMMSFWEQMLLSKTTVDVSQCIVDLCSKCAITRRLSDLLARNLAFLQKERLEYIVTVLCDKLGEKKPSLQRSETPNQPPPQTSSTPPPTTATAANQTTMIEQIMDLFPDSDVELVKEALNKHNNSAESVIAAALDNTIALKQDKQKQQQQQPRQKVFVGKKPFAIEEEEDAPTTALKQKILERLDRMEDEEERERIRLYEQLRRSGLASEAEYNDDFDDSLVDTFAHTSSQREGESLKEDEEDDDEEGSEEEQEEEKGKGKMQQPQSRPVPGPGKYKDHHRKDRSSRKRSALFPH